MAVTFLAEGVEQEGLDFVVSPIAEFGAVLHLMTDPEHHAPFRDHGRRLLASLRPQLAEEIERFAPLWTGYRCRLLYPLTSAPSHRELNAELADILAMDDGRFLEAYLWGVLGGHTGAPPLGSGLSPDAQETVLERARQRSTTALRLAERVLLDPAAERVRFVELLEAVAAQLSAEWGNVAGPLLGEAQARRTLLEEDGVVATLVGLTPGARVASGPKRVIFDKLHHGIIDVRRRPVTAIPSVFGWPHLLAKHEATWPVLIQYPLGLTSLRREAPSAAVLQRRLTVLSHPGRVKVCRLLAREELSTSELARLLGMPTPQMSRLLRPMREVGVLVGKRDGHFVRYHLNLDVLGQLGADLVASLLR